MSSSRDVYVQKMKAKLDEWNAEIDKLEARMQQKEADSREQYRKQIDALKDQRRSAQETLSKIRQAGSDAWDDLRAGLDRAAQSMGEALRAARSRFE